jgi:hypothetical protein
MINPAAWVRGQWRQWQARAYARYAGSFQSDIHEPTDPVFYPDGVDYTIPPAMDDATAADPDKRKAFFESTYGTPHSPGNWAQTQFAPPYRDGHDNPVAIPTDNPLREWSNQMRWRVLVSTHSAFHRNPLAKRAVNVTRQFAVGRGHTINYLNQDVREAIEAFRDDPENDVRRYEKTFVQDLMVDGELFIRFAALDGRVVIVPLKPWRVIGINTDPEFFRRVNFYRYQLLPQDRILDPQNTAPEVPAPDNTPGSIPNEIQIEARDMVHVALNNHSYELRGRPDLFVILTWLKGHKNWLEERARQNKWRGALLWIVRILSNAPGIIASKRSQYKTPPKSGSLVVTSQNEEWTAANNPVGANDASEDGRQLRLMVANGVDLPEYMLGDGENANLATASAQELPALWKFTDVQEIMREQVWTPVYKRVLQEQIDTGDLPNEVVIQDAQGDPVLDGNGNQQMIPTLKAFQVQYYDLQADEPKTLAEALGIATSGEWVSDEGAREVIAPVWGLDPNTESRRIEKERTEREERAGVGAFMPPGGPMPGLDDEDDENPRRNGQEVADARSENG